MLGRKALSNITNKSKAAPRKFTAFTEENDLPLRWNDEVVDLNLDLSPIKESAHANTIDRLNVYQETLLMSPKANYPPDKSQFVLDYRKALEEFPKIFSDENYLDPEVVNSYIDYCANLKEISESSESTNNFERRGTSDSSLRTTTPPNSTTVLSLPQLSGNSPKPEKNIKEDQLLPSLKIKDMTFGKKILRKIWVRREKKSLPKTDIEDFL